MERSDHPPYYTSLTQKKLTAILVFFELGRMGVENATLVHQTPGLV